MPGDGLACNVQNATPSEVEYLSARLSGGAGMMTWLYSVLGTVNVTTTLVDSVVDRMGLAPNVAATSTARPTWDGALKTITGDGINDRLAWTANNAAGDLTTVKAIVCVGVFNDAAAPSKYLASIADSATENRLMALLNSTTNIFATAGATPSFGGGDTGVAKSTSMRVAIASHDGGVTLTGQALSHTAGTGVIVPLGAGTNRLTLFDEFPGVGTNATGPIRAVLGLNAEPTAGDLTVLGTWGVSYHGAVLAA